MTALATFARPAHVRFEEAEPDDLPKLIALALVLAPSRRRARFGAALADEAIRRHYRALDFSRFLAFGAFVQGRLEAVVELYALGSDWRRAEICAMGLPGAQARWTDALAEGVAARAQDRGCVECVWIEVGAPDGWAAALRAALPGMRTLGAA